METKTNKEEFAFFYGGTMSQWARSKFVIDGMTFSHCEQYMMYRKAMLFGDQITADKIMKADHPKRQKELGREVKPYDDEKWDAICREVVYEANVAKFSQNPEMKKELMFTAGKTLVEASYKDRKWGIGLAANDPLAQDRKTWKGTNWLGEAIERVREDMISGVIAE